MDIPQLQPINLPEGLLWRAGDQYSLNGQPIPPETAQALVASYTAVGPRPTDPPPERSDSRNKGGLLGTFLPQPDPKPNFNPLLDGGYSNLTGPDSGPKDAGWWGYRKHLGQMGVEGIGRIPGVFNNYASMSTSQNPMLSNQQVHRLIYPEQVQQEVPPPVSQSTLFGQMQSMNPMLATGPGAIPR
jgi:hypothetical protein